MYILHRFRSIYLQNWVVLEGISDLVQFAPAFMSSSSQGIQTGYLFCVLM